ncbi:TetR/AcrR family transcriptional regulator [Cryptosporangium aurantiacum]|uniref:Transcriptional regulator, TetR family n=1 Tax=Cryptosporangium aurantiacum TaxID=134849 RepID=A0A1M7RDC8_9ACTN|nr:TetR/AcrR family transcriptional regulator [Cryptosporangium aurantiacum]SHN44152.1 transcriptional regulator, TetR family [Cryptosporangium aurantiacum]
MSAESTTSPRRRPAKRGEGDRLRDEIVLAACGLLAETGEMSSLSLRAVARKVGVATTSIYLHFDNLGALQRAVKDRWLDMLTAEVEAAASEAGDDPRERILAISHAYVDAGMRDPARYRVLFTSELLPLPDGVQYLGGGTFEAVLQIVRQALPDHVDASLFTMQFWCALHGIVTLRQARPNFPWPDLHLQVDDLVTRLVDSAVHSV